MDKKNWYMDKVLCPDAQYHGESSVNVVLLVSSLYILMGYIYNMYVVLPERNTVKDKAWYIRTCMGSDVTNLIPYTL